jgi:hypothetical protein
MHVADKISTRGFFDEVAKAFAGRSDALWKECENAGVPRRHCSGFLLRHMLLVDRQREDDRAYDPDQSGGEEWGLRGVGPEHTADDGGGGY